MKNLHCLFERSSESELLERYREDESLRFHWLDGLSPLHRAVLGGMPDLVRLLLSQGEDPNLRNRFGGASLHLLSWIAQQRRDPRCTPIAIQIGNQLIDSGCLTNIQDDEGRNALNLSADWLENFHDRRGLVEFFLEAGEDPNLPDSRGRAVLHNMADGENYALEAYKLLIEAGADVEQKDNQGKTPLLLFRETTDFGGHIHCPRAHYDKICSLLSG